jgi:histidine phosphotransfer protein HptB
MDPRAMLESSIIDLHAIENLRALNPGAADAFVRDVASIFIADTPLRLAELERSLAAGDVTVFTRAAHSIKGSSANLGAFALRAAAEKLEHQSREHGLAEVTPLVAEVRAEFQRASAALTALVAR